MEPAAVQGVLMHFPAVLDRPRPDRIRDQVILWAPLLDFGLTHR